MAKKSESPSDAALARVREVCHAFAGVEEKLSHGMPSFHVRGKMIVNFVDNHHGDGRLAVWCKCTFERQRELVAHAPAVYFVPPYVGVRGWLGINLNHESTDWIELAMIVEAGWLSVAPPKLARGEGANPVAKKPPPPPKRPMTSAKAARDGLARLTKICLALSDATVEADGIHATFHIGKKAFVYFLDNHHGDGAIVACVRGARTANASLVKKLPGRYTSPAYIGPRGWLGIRIDGKSVDWEEIGDRVAKSYAEVASKPKPHPKTSAKRAART